MVVGVGVVVVWCGVVWDVIGVGLIPQTGGGDGRGIVEGWRDKSKDHCLRYIKFNTYPWVSSNSRFNVIFIFPSNIFFDFRTNIFSIIHYRLS